MVAHALGNQVTVKGPPDACERARHVLQMLYDRINLGQSISIGDIDGAIQEGLLQGVLFPAGADVFRLNFSHGTQEDHAARFAMIRELEDRFDRPIGVLADVPARSVA